MKKLTAKQNLAPKIWLKFKSDGKIIPDLALLTRSLLYGMTRIYNHAQDDVDAQTRKQCRMIRNSLTTLHTLGQMILDAAIADESLRQTLFNKVDREHAHNKVAVSLRLWA